MSLSPTRALVDHMSILFLFISCCASYLRLALALSIWSHALSYSRTRSLIGVVCLCRSVYPLHDLTFSRSIACRSLSLWVRSASLTLSTIAVFRSSLIEPTIRSLHAALRSSCRRSFPVVRRSLACTALRSVTALSTRLCARSLLILTLSLAPFSPTHTHSLVSCR